MSSLFGFVNHYPVLSYLLLALQIGFIIHALTNRRQIYWVFIIFFIPVLGVLLYFFVEILPGMRVRRVNLDPVVERLQSGDARIARRREQLADLDTLQNRVNLAAELSKAGRMEEAEDTLRPLLSGIYKDDPQLLYQLAELKYRRGDFQEARTLLMQVDAMRSQTMQAKVKVLLAEVQLRLGDKVEAERQLREAMRGAVTEEPRVKLIQLLLQEGRTDEARGLLDQVEKTYRRANGLYKSQEREWFRLAEQLRQGVR